MSLMRRMKMHYHYASCAIFHKQVDVMTEMLTAKEVQEMLQVDRSTVYRMAEAGRIPAIKVGSSGVFRRSKLITGFKSKWDRLL